MMIRAARGDDIERLVALLSSKMSAKITPDRWRRLFDYPWRPNDSDFGSSVSWEWSTRIARSAVGPSASSTSAPGISTSKSSRLGREDIDNLYSEVQFPDLKLD